MASKPTRASTRAKTVTAPPTPRTTRAKTATKAAPLRNAIKNAAPRVPLLNRGNSPEHAVPEVKVVASTKVPRSKVACIPSDAEREPIMAYLRIRPYLGDGKPTSLPYLSPLSDTNVRMTDPRQDAQTKSSALRPSVLPQSSIYTFSHVFPPNSTQSDFFTRTTLPLVKDVLQGQNALLFTYGVTNSGKTYTVQGGIQEGSAGILPRTLDVVFNSIEGLQGNGRYRPVRLRGIEVSDATDVQTPQFTLPQPVLREAMAEHLTPTASDTDVDPTILALDRNYEYSIWISYAEVYNEKVYDLLETVKDDAATSGIPRPGTANGMHPLLLTRKALQLKPCPASDFDLTATNSGKYVSGLRQFRVQSASQAKALVKLGQIHRRVFGTLANRESSRSHGMVIIKVVRGHRGERDDPRAFQVSRLTLVDLAGSERTKHTQTTGDRLKEAGNINKSLMVLGQCMEVMRANQRRVAMSLAAEGVGRMDTRDVKKGLAVVPFRHSKLTEALMDYFVEDGRVVMIVNVNPYDTGYDENSNVMKFAALAREVYVSTAMAPTHKFPSRQTLDKKSRGIALKGDTASYRRKVTISMGGQTRVNEAVVEVLEEDEAEEDDGDEPTNSMVDALFDEVEELQMRLFEAEMRCAIIEAETREEVMREMEERMRSMERMYSKRLMDEVKQNEMKTDAKIDMLQQSGLLMSPTKQSRTRTEQFEEDSDMHLTEDDEYGSEAGEEIVFGSDEESAFGLSNQSPSPLARKGGSPRVESVITSTGRRETRQFVPDGPEAVLLSSDEEVEDEEMTDVTETDDANGELDSVVETGTESRFDSEDDDDDENEWIPTPPSCIPRAAMIDDRQRQQQRTPSPPKKATRSRQNASRSTSKLATKMENLSICSTPEDPLDLLRPPKTRKQRIPKNADTEDVSATVKKKKPGQAEKKAVASAEQAGGRSLRKSKR